MTKKKKPQKVLTCKVDETFANRVDSYVRRNDTDRSKMIRRGLEMVLEQERQERKQ